MVFDSYVAIGDSFSEGVGDELADGSVRGWTDLVAIGLDRAAPGGIRYANLAIRGRKLGPIVGEQLDAAIALRPELLSINGGGNDLMRPSVRVENLSASLRRAVERAVDAGIHVLLASGGDPSVQLPLGSVLRRRGDAYAREVRSWLDGMPGVTWVDNWNDEGLREPRHWSADRLHLGPHGHRRAARNALTALGVPVPAELDQNAPLEAEPRIAPDRARYYREYVVPWVGRRLTGRSSGDGREPKRPALLPLDVR